MSILCKLGFHRNVYTEKMYPSTNAKIVTNWSGKIFCTKCGKVKSVWSYDYDPITGQLIEKP